jgi:cation:H+ antiporter
MIFFWVLIFIGSLVLLVKGADWFVESAEKVGLALKMSPFIIGVTIVAVGTSFPEAAVSIAATLRGATEVVVSTAIGSATANILLIVGLSAIVARRLIVKRSLIDLDAPLLATTTILFVFIMWDKQVVFIEGVLLLLAFLAYILSTVFRKEEEEETPEIVEVLPSRVERRKKIKVEKKKGKASPKLSLRIFLFLILGIVGLVVGAQLNIKALLELSALLRVSTSLIAITAVAIGTSLPDMVVSVMAAAKKKYEIALGNIFGSNVFLVLAVVGLPALIKPLAIDSLTFYIGLPFLITATFLFIISGISRRIHIWEGLMYILIYVLFVARLVNLI